MRGSARPPLQAALTALGVAAVAAAGLWLLAGGHLAVRRWVEGPEAGIRRALDGIAARAPGGGATAGPALRIERLRFRDPLVTVREGGADVVAVADAEGTVEWRDHPVAVAYLGRERLSMSRCPGEGWCPKGAALPRLDALLATLARRAAAFDDADAEGYRALVADDYRDPQGGKAELLRRLTSDLRARPRARMRPIAWQVRIERETAQVGEDFEVAVGGRAARRLRARLDLREEGGRWRFTGGL